MTTVSRLQVGLDVPWVTSWSDEPETGVAPCPSVDGQLAIGQAENAGVGRPLYSQNHLFRQRRAVREMLCPMCGRPTPAHDRWTQTGYWTTAGELRARGFGPALPADLADAKPLLNCGAIAPLHHACAQAAVTRCPHLSSRPDKSLKRFPGAWVVIPLWIEARTSRPPARSVPVVSFLQLVGLEP